MGKQGTAVTTMFDFDGHEFVKSYDKGLTPRWKQYKVVFGDSYSSGGETVSLTLNDDFPYGVLAATVYPTIVSSTSNGPYLTSASMASGTLKLKLYQLHADDFLFEEVAGSTDVYTSSSDCLTCYVTVFGY